MTRSYLSALLELDSCDTGWKISANEPWISAARRTHRPQQGWKIHVSASLAAADEVLSRTLSVLKSHAYHFKVAQDDDVLRQLNAGLLGHSQVGKFISIYPPDDAAAVRIAELIAAACEGLEGPRVPSDYRLRPNSVVYYRYGTFGAIQMRQPLGEYVRMMRGPNGVLIPDHVAVWPETPEGIANPFAARLAREPAPESKPGPIPDHFEGYVPIKCLGSSPKGTVFLAIDLVKLRRCIIKQANSHIPLGSCWDAVKYLRREASTLFALGGAGIGPEAYCLVDMPDYSYLVMEDLPFQTLEEVVGGRTKELSPQNRLSLAVAISRVVAALHDRGYAHGDLKTANILVSNDLSVKLVDFELAAPIGSRPVDERGTKGYIRERLDPAIVSVADDIHAMGAILFLATGHEPSTTVFRRILDDPRFAASMATKAPALHAIGAACVRGKVSTAAELCLALEEPKPAYTNAPPSQRRGVLDDPPFDERAVASAIAGTAHALCDTASQLLRPRPSYTIKTDLNDGLSGLLIGLLIVPEATTTHTLARELSVQVADLLVSQLSKPDISLPGLFVGDMGAALALAFAGRTLCESRFERAALELANRSVAANITNPDLFHGLAGRLLGSALLWQRFDRQEFRCFAREDGARLANAFCRDKEGSISFEIPAGYSGLSGGRYVGAAHGTAGVGIALAKGFRCMASEDLDILRETRDSVIRQALGQKDGDAAWPVEHGTAEVAGPFWCHGLGGVTQFLIECDSLLKDEMPREYLEHCVQTLGRIGWHFGLDLCHGSAGSVDTLALARDHGHLQSDLAKQEYHRCCNAFLKQVEALNSQANGGMESKEQQYGLMVGYPGVLYALLRISGEHKIPSLWTLLAGSRGPLTEQVEALVDA